MYALFDTQLIALTKQVFALGLQPGSFNYPVDCINPLKSEFIKIEESTQARPDLAGSAVYENPTG